MVLTLATDCRYYRGDKPCRFSRRCRCDRYATMGFRVLVIKIGALGDVVRTACLLPTVKRLYEPSHVTWVTRPNGVRLLKNHPQIDQLIPFDAEGIVSVTNQTFDLVLSLDKETAPAGLCAAVRSPDKRGIILTSWGTIAPCNSECEPYFELGLDDDLKFHRNRLTYPELIHEAVGFDYFREPYRLFCDDSASHRARAMFRPWRARGGGPVVGLNTGSGKAFANKAPKPAWWVELARRLCAMHYTVVLLGGPEETRAHDWMLEQMGPDVYTTGNDNTEPQFVAIVDQCDLVVTGDTLALHVAVGRQVPTVALFGPTCHQEIDLFDRGRKVISPLGCGPCYRGHCDKKLNCMDMITVDDVAEALESLRRMLKPSLLPAS